MSLPKTSGCLSFCWVPSMRCFPSLWSLACRSSGLPRALSLDSDVCRGSVFHQTVCPSLPPTPSTSADGGLESRKDVRDSRETTELLDLRLSTICLEVQLEKLRLIATWEGGRRKVVLVVFLLLIILLCY